MFLYDLLDKGALDAAIADGLVVRRAHPEEPLAILNYTQRAQFLGSWDACAVQCRGLIHRTDTLEVVSRPFRKFFNYGEPCAPVLDFSEPAIVTDKMDGSLGILYPTSAGHAIATRGSFNSEQAIHATELWRERYGFQYTPPPGLTLLFEVIYPENRIVVDYGAFDDLVLLGAIQTSTGEYLDPLRPELSEWDGPRVEVFPYDSLAEALAAPPRKNAEGMVVYLPGLDERVKIKQEDYVELHRIVTGLNERVVWEHLASGGELDELTAPLPEEFREWTTSVYYGLLGRFESERNAVVREHIEIVHSLPRGWSRKEFAQKACQSPRRAALFAFLDAKVDQVARILWESVRPTVAAGPRSVASE